MIYNKIVVLFIEKKKELWIDLITSYLFTLDSALNSIATLLEFLLAGDILTINVTDITIDHHFIARSLRDHWLYKEQDREI